MMMTMTMMMMGGFFVSPLCRPLQLSFFVLAFFVILEFLLNLSILREAHGHSISHTDTVTEAALLKKTA